MPVASAELTAASADVWRKGIAVGLIVFALWSPTVEPAPTLEFDSLRQ